MKHIVSVVSLYCVLYTNFTTYLLNPLYTGQYLRHLPESASVAEDPENSAETLVLQVIKFVAYSFRYFPGFAAALLI